MADAFTIRKFEWLSAVARDGDLRPSAVRLAIILVNEFVNGDEFRDSGTLSAWPSADRLAGELGMTRRGVQKGTDSLVERGHLDRQIGGGWKVTNRYTLRFKDEIPRTGVHCNGSELRTPVHPFGAKTVNSRSGKLRTPVHPNPLKEPIDERESTDSLSEAFKGFWNQYPRRAGKKTAEKAFGKAVKEGASPQDIIAGAMRYAAERDGQEARFTKHPSTWLNAGCWEDEPAPQGANTRQSNQRMSAAEFARRREEAIKNGEWK